MIFKTPLEHLLVIDIETVSQKEDFSELDTTWKILWEEKNRYMLPDNTTIEAYYTARAGIMAEFAKVVVISIGYFKKEADGWKFRVKSIAQENEQRLLESFTQILRQLEMLHSSWCFAGHNIKEFDIPFLCRRLVVNGLEIPMTLDRFRNKKPWETSIIDTFQQWRFGDYKNYTSLKLLAAALDIPSPKDDLEGSQVGETYWKLKDLPRIVTYCQKDVVTVANIILRFRREPLLTSNQVIFVS